MKSNLHALVHLADMLRDGGPGYVWWCFGAERFNGMIEGKAKSKVHLDTSLGNSVWLDDLMLHAQFITPELHATYMNQILQPYGVLQPNPANIIPCGYFLSGCGATNIQLSHQQRMALKEHIQSILRQAEVQINEIPRHCNKFAKFQQQTGYKHMLGSIRSQSTHIVNRDSSWIEYCEPNDDSEDLELLWQFGQVDYYTTVLVLGREYHLAWVHHHPVDVLDINNPDRMKQLIRIIPNDELATRRGRRFHRGQQRNRAQRRRYQNIPVAEGEPRLLSQKWTWVNIDCIKGLVGRINTTHGQYIIRPMDDYAFIDPAIEFIDPIGLDQVQDN